jgi:hypothetical protein
MRGPRNCRMLIWVVMLIATVGVMTGCSPESVQQAGKLTYRLPTEITVELGQNVPGTDIRYERMAEQGATLRIKGQSALKRKGDSVDWDGNLATGVKAELRLRVAWYTDKAIYLVGTAKVEIEEVDPRLAKVTTTSAIKFVGPVAYNVTKGGKIPGTTIIYTGETSDGAKFEGLEDYPFRKSGDSLLWEGTLRAGVYARLEARVLQFDARGLRTGGVMTLWVGA